MLHWTSVLGAMLEHPKEFKVRLSFKVVIHVVIKEFKHEFCGVIFHFNLLEERRNDEEEYMF